MISLRSLRGAAALAVLCATALVAVGAAGGTPIASAQVTSLASGGEYHPVTPTRIFDTRLALNTPLGPKPANPTGQSFTFDALGQGGIPAEVAGTNRDVLAVVLNVTVDLPSRAGYLSISPAGSAAGTSSLVNFNAG